MNRRANRPLTAAAACACALFAACLALPGAGGRRGDAGQEGGGKSMSTQSNATGPSTDIEALGRHVNLPRRPVSVVWRAFVQGSEAGREVPGPTDYYVLAVLTFSPEDIEAIVAEAAGREPPRFPASLEDVEWLPPDVRKYAFKEPGEEDYRLRGRVYDPSAFVKPPLMGGYALRVGDTTHLFIHLYTT